jgi:hypothetical protein
MPVLAPVDLRPIRALSKVAFIESPFLPFGTLHLQVLHQGSIGAEGSIGADWTRIPAIALADMANEVAWSGGREGACPLPLRIGGWRLVRRDA